MPSTQVVQVVVEKLNKFGFYDQMGGVYYSKNLKDTDKLKVVPGAKFNAEYYVADSGSRYLNKVFDMLVTTEQVKKETKFSTHKEEHPFATNPEDFKSQPIPASNVRPLVNTTKATEQMTKAEWSAKDRSQLIGGLSHDAATLVAAAMPLQPFNNTEEILIYYKQVLEGLLRIRDEVK